MDWLRLWHDMPNDPKWRTISRISKRSISEVMSVYLHIMVNASANADERGRTKNLKTEDIASALDMEEDHVSQIIDSMQGRVLDGDVLTGWEKRQPKREDGSAERAKKWRERKRTQANADKRPEEDKDTDTDTEKNKTTTASPGGDGVAAVEMFKRNFRCLLPSGDVVRDIKSLVAEYGLEAVEESFIAANAGHKSFAWAKSRLKERSKWQDDDPNAWMREIEEEERLKNAAQ